jgi:hypothetical protein
VVASLNEDHGNSFTRGQTISAASGQTALTLNGESGGSAPTLVINDNASNPLMYVNAAGALVVVNVDTPTEHGIFDFRADPAFGGSAMYLESNTNGSRRIYIGSPGQTWYSLNLTHLAAGIEGLARLDLNVANGGDALFIGGQVIMHRADPAFQFGPQGYFSLLTFHAGSSTALMTLDSASGGSLTLAIIFLPVQAPTASAPSYVKGAIYFDTTLNKLRVGGASGWETITSV